MQCCGRKWWLSVGVVGFVGGAWMLLAAQGPAPVSAAESQPSGQVAVEESMHEFMEYVYQPTYVRLKNTMAGLSGEKPDWKLAKADSLILAESGNLLLLRGPKEDREMWAQLSIATRDSGKELYQAARAKDATKAKAAYTTLIERCNACHDHFADGEHQLEP